MRTDEKRGRLTAAAASLLYVAVWLLLIFFVTCRREEILPPEGGMLVNFGDSETAFGSEDLPMSDDLSAATTPSSVTSPVPDEFVTQPSPDAPVVADPAAERDPAQRPPVEAERRPNPQSLFPGRSASQSTSEGVGQGTGNQGNPAGAADGSHDGTGVGASGDNFDLAGRSLVGSLPKPGYNIQEEGRVVIEIRVDASGRVTGEPVYRAAGSTTNNRTLVNLAIEAAKKARFTEQESGGAPVQAGTITYNFRLSAD